MEKNNKIVVKNGKNRKPIINEQLKARAKSINWKRVIVGLLAILYLIFSTISMLTRCTNVGASSAGVSKQNWSPLLPFSSLQYTNSSHGNYTETMYDVDMPQMTNGKNSSTPFYNTFVEASSALTTNYTYTFKEIFPDVYNGIVNETDNTKTIEFTISNIETNATANVDHTTNAPPYINYYKVLIYPKVFYNDNLLGAEYRIFGGYNGTDYENTSTIVYSQYYSVNTNDDGSSSVERVSTWYYEPYTLTNFRTILDLYDNNNLLLNTSITLLQGTTMEEVMSFFEITTSRTATLDSVNFETQGIAYELAGTTYIDGGTGYKATYHIPLNVKSHAYLNQTKDLTRYNIHLLAHNFILDTELYNFTSTNNYFGIKKNFAQYNGTDNSEIVVTWNVTQVFQQTSVVDGSKYITAVTNEVIIRNQDLMENIGSEDIYYIYFPYEELKIMFEEDGYDISESRYFIINHLKVTIRTPFTDFGEQNHYIDLIIPYYKTSAMESDIVKWYYDQIGDGYKGGADGTLTAPQDFFEWLIIAVDGFLSAPIIGIISLGEILWFCVGIGILFAVLKYFAGG